MDNSQEPITDKFPTITPETINKSNALIDFVPLAEMVARKELKLMPNHMADFRELVNLGLIKIHHLIKQAQEKQESYKPSYIIQGITWDLRNVSRKDSTQRGEFRHSNNTTNTGGLFDQASLSNTDNLAQKTSFSLAEIQSALVESVLSIDNEGFDLADEKAVDPQEATLKKELYKVLHDAIALLPDNYYQAIELRFFRGYKNNQIADIMGVSSARITKIISDAIELIKTRLSEKRLL